MLYNYLKIAFRSLMKFKGYASINLIGLCPGLNSGHTHYDLCSR
jgi:putative ABC transport system permease protein